MTRYTQAAGFVLAGGANTRMGRDKALLPLGGAPLLQRTGRMMEPLVKYVAVVGRRPDHAGFGWRVLTDDKAGLGPLAGIATALRMAPQLDAGTVPWNLVVACDMPYLEAEWLDFLLSRASVSGADVVMSHSLEGPEPLCAVYHQRIARTVAAALAAGKRKVTDALEGLQVEYVLPQEWKPFASCAELFKNMNTPEDYAEAQAKFSSE